MDWFEELPRFRERSYSETRAKLETVGEHLVSRESGIRYAVGMLELPSLSELRNTHTS